MTFGILPFYNQNQIPLTVKGVDLIVSFTLIELHC
jgi:hypothetical protein